VYRLGVSRSTWPQLLGGDRLEETVVHFGSGFDLHDRLGRCDVAVEYARIGSLDRNGYEESRWGIVVSLTGQEMWRRKRSGK
jgi:hypothetical protein